MGAGGLLVVSLGGCTTPYGQPNHTGTGALIGGASGAGIGALLAHCDPALGALIGGATGALFGGLAGNSMDQQARAPAYVAGPPPQPQYEVASAPQPQASATQPQYVVAGAPGEPPYVWVKAQYVWNGHYWAWTDGHWATMP